MANIVKPSLETAWQAAARLVARWLDRRERIDLIMESLPAALAGAERRRCQHLVFGVVRHFGRIEGHLGRLVAHPPRFVTRAVLFIAAYELIEAGSADGGQPARIVHHAVERAKELASPAEARLVNAVVRRLSKEIPAEAEPGPLAPSGALASYYSHPEWLVRRWLAEFGAKDTRKFLTWNQSPAPVFARWRDRSRPAPDWLAATQWPGFHAVPAGRWSEIEALLAEGALYLQDPGTRLAVDLLAPRPGEAVLDLCASPGGKSMLVVDAMGEGALVAVDLPGSRIERLKENLSRCTGVRAALVQADLLKGLGAVLREHRLAEAYPAVLLDAPCSNTGVMRHRVDVKWRLEEGDIPKHARQQGAMLAAASRLVAPGGRLVYSTCSVDAAENEGVVKAFLDRHRGFSLGGSVSAYPWVDGHDGAAAFLLARS